MRNTVARTESASGVRERSRRFRLAPVVAALAACSLLGAGAAQAALILDSSGTNEPNNSLATATPGGVGDEFRGCVGDTGGFCPPNTSLGSGENDVDFVGYFGLNPLATYKLSLTELCVLCGVSVTFDLYRNLSTSIDQSRIVNPGLTTDIAGLTGFTNLKVGIHTGGCCEGYNVALALVSAPTGVPEPASIVLIAAGLAAALATRRRKRS